MSEDDSESDGEGDAGSNDRDSDSGSSSDYESSSSESGSEEASDDKGTQQDGLDNEGEGSDSEAEESDTGGSDSPSKSDHTGSPPKASPPVKKKAPKANLNTSQMLSLPDLDSKDLEEEQKAQQCRDACLLDKGFSKWQDQKISEGLQQWDERNKMTCDHMDSCKEAKSPNPLGLPLDYMMSHGVFKPKKQASMTCATSSKWGSLETYQSSPHPMHLQQTSK